LDLYAGLSLSFTEKANVNPKMLPLIILQIEEKIGSPHPLRLGDRKTMLPTVLFQMTKGYVGILTPLLQEMYLLLGVFNDHLNDFSRVKFTSETIDISW